MTWVGRIHGAVLVLLGLVGMLAWAPRAVAYQTTSGVVVEQVAELRDHVSNAPTGRTMVRVRYYPNGTETTTLAVPARKEAPGVGANVRLRYHPDEPQAPVLTGSLPLAYWLALTGAGLTLVGVALVALSLRRRPQGPGPLGAPAPR